MPGILVLGMQASSGLIEQDPHWKHPLDSLTMKPAEEMGSVCETSLPNH
jgi:hypothetical protein